MYTEYTKEINMKLNKPEENLMCCTTIRVSLDTRALLSDVRAKHFLKEKEDLQSYNEIIRFLYEVFQKYEGK